jgi:hypothetical protein
MKATIPVGESVEERKTDLHEIFSLIKHSYGTNSRSISSVVT